jgi:hypothetical protein
VGGGHPLINIIIMKILDAYGISDPLFTNIQCIFANSNEDNFIKATSGGIGYNKKQFQIAILLEADFKLEYF